MSTCVISNVLEVVFIKKFEDIKVTKEALESVVENIKYNELILMYYSKYEQEQRGLKEAGAIYYFDPDTIINKMDRMSSCNKWWLIDRFDISKVKNFKKTILCKDKFCNNCKKVKQAQRMARYIPELKKYKDSLYHLVLTVPNVKGEDLKDTIKKIVKAFRKLMYYIRGERVIRGYEWLSDAGYKGAVRTLEVTFKDDIYHPHFHIGIVFDNVELDKLKKKHVNSYSYSYGDLKNYFSDIEILIQKLWYLIINDIRITASNIDNLKEGYSCKLEKFKEDEYQELFKYLVKGQDENNNFSYENFKTLYESLHRVKQIQGYGVLYKIDDDLDDELLEDLYNEFIEELYRKEIPIEIIQSPGELIEDKEYILISKKSYIKYLKEIGEL